jgi:RimJ/RimL family protein N-acetyltransferase
VSTTLADRYPHKMRRAQPTLVGKVRLVQPFPPEYIWLLWKWSDPVWFRIADDFTPHDPVAYVEWQECIEAQDNTLSWGVYRGDELGGLIRAVVDPLRPWQADLHVLFKKDFWGRHNTVPAMLLVFAELLGPRGLKKLNTATFASNSAINSLIAEIGGVKEGVRRRATLKDGKLVDMVLYGMTPEDFEARLHDESALMTLLHANAEVPAAKGVN